MSLLERHGLEKIQDKRLANELVQELGRFLLDKRLPIEVVVGSINQDVLLDLYKKDPKFAKMVHEILIENYKDINEKYPFLLPT